MRLSLVPQSVQQYADLETKVCLLLLCDVAPRRKGFQSSFETSEILYPMSQRHTAGYEQGFYGLGVVVHVQLLWWRQYDIKLLRETGISL
jgi:hypothetical protein